VKIPRHTLEAIKKAVPLSALVREAGIRLLRESGQWKGKCPFHEDGTPSFSVDDDKDGGVYFCHGCSERGDAFRFLEKTRGLSFIDAAKELAGRAGVELVSEVARTGDPQLVATYPYVEADGTHIFAVERWEPGFPKKDGSQRRKDYLPRLPDGTSKKSERQVLYRLPDVIKAVAAGELVFIVEGEKCADALAALGLCATTAAGGAGLRKTWPSEGFAAPLARARLVLIADHDKSGREYMDHVAVVVGAVAAEVRRLDLGLKEEGADVADWLAAGGTREQLVDLAKAAPVAGDDWETKLRRSRGAGFVVIGALDNAMLILEQHDAFRGALFFDVRAFAPFTRRAFPWEPPGKKFPRVISDADVANATRFMSVEYDATFSVETVGRAMWTIAGNDPHDEIADYLLAVHRQWDGKTRIDTWLSDFAGAVDNRYTRAVARAWLVSAVKRSLVPGCQADHVLVLEGSQGLRKSSLLRALAGERYFSDQLPDISNKDASLVLLRTWIQELAELEAIGKKETPTVRAFLTRRVEVFRPPYGKGVVDVPRRMVFAATTNEDDYLRDPAGNRRYWPVLCGRCEVDGLLEVRDHLWAEAVELYKTDEPIWLEDPELAQLARQEQEARESVDPWHDLVAHKVAGRPHVDVSTLLLELDVPKAKLSGVDAKRIATILKKLQWQRKQRRVDGRQTWVYVRPDDDDVTRRHQVVTRSDDLDLSSSVTTSPPSPGGSLAGARAYGDDELQPQLGLLANPDPIGRPGDSGDR
jgi:predicted P-loop ATPase